MTLGSSGTRTRVRLHRSRVSHCFSCTKGTSFLLIEINALDLTDSRFVPEGFDTGLLHQQFDNAEIDYEFFQGIVFDSTVDGAYWIRWNCGVLPDLKVKLPDYAITQKILMLGAKASNDQGGEKKIDRLAIWNMSTRTGYLMAKAVPEKDASYSRTALSDLEDLAAVCLTPRDRGRVAILRTLLLPGAAVGGVIGYVMDGVPSAIAGAVAAAFFLSLFFFLQTGQSKKMVRIHFGKIVQSLNYVTKEDVA